MCVIYGCAVKPFIADSLGKEKELISCSFIKADLATDNVILIFNPKECEGIKKIGLKFENDDITKSDFNIKIHNESHSRIKIHWHTDTNNSIYKDIPISIKPKTLSDIKKISGADNNFQFYVDLSELESNEQPIVLKFE